MHCFQVESSEGSLLKGGSVFDLDSLLAFVHWFGWRGRERGIPVDRHVYGTKSVLGPGSKPIK